MNRVTSHYHSQVNRPDRASLGLGTNEQCAGFCHARVLLSGIHRLGKSVDARSTACGNDTEVAFPLFCQSDTRDFQLEPELNGTPSDERGFLSTILAYGVKTTKTIVPFTTTRPRANPVISSGGTEGEILGHHHTLDHYRGDFSSPLLEMTKSRYGIYSHPLIAAVAALCFALLLSVPANAQSSGIVVTHVVTQEAEEHLGLNAFFTLIDGNGRAVIDANPNGGTVELLGGTDVPRDVTITRPNTPFHIALLLDGSGSMANVISDVRVAAKTALQNAPPTANFAVIKFNQLSVDEELRPIQSFTNDRNLVASAIDAVTADAGASTCLYNTVHKAVELLDNHIKNPQERRAIILFTDGKDETPAGTPCSQRDFDGVVYRASQSGPVTPVHTIGLCSNPQCTNINRGELVNLAEQTLGFSAIGSQTNLENLFTEIMDGLNSQWLARSNVLAREGLNQGILTLSLGNNNNPFSLISPPFQFASARDYTNLRQPTDVRIQSIVYDANTDRYNLTLLTTSPEFIQRIIVNIWDTRRGIQVSPDLFFFNPGLSVLTELETTNFEAGREYRVQIQALDNTETLIQKQTNDDFGSDDEPLSMLDQATVVYDPPLPPEPEPVEFVIEAVNTNYEAETLTIDFNILDDTRVLAVEGFIKSGGGQKIYEFGPLEYESKRLRLPLPQSLQSARGQQYPVTVYLTTREGQRSQFEFEEFRPTRPGMMQRSMTWFRNNTIVVLSAVVFFISCAMAWLFLQNRREEKRSQAPPRPPIEGTIPVDPVLLEAPPQPAQVYIEPPAVNGIMANGMANVQASSSGSLAASSSLQMVQHERAQKPAHHAIPQDAYQATLEQMSLHSSLEPVGLRMNFTQVTGKEQLPETILVDFPFVIGRDESLEHGRVANRGNKRFLNVGADAKISRAHIEITLVQGDYYITDLGSRNGTFIAEQQLDALQPTRLSGHTKVRLGRQIHLELEPIT